MNGILSVITVQLIWALISVEKRGLCDKPSGDRLLSKGVISDVKSWTSSLHGAVVVYRGFDVHIPCLLSGNNHSSKHRPTVTGNKSYVWYDSDNKTVDGARLVALDDGTLKIMSAQSSDTGRYVCIPPTAQRQQQRRQVHYVVVVFMPIVSVDYTFVYRVPMCEDMRMSQKADWYSDKAELENAERAADESIELSVSNYSCSSAVSLRGFDGAYHHYRLVISARLNSAARRLAQYKLLLRGTTDNCDVRCQLKAAVDAILNQSRPIIDRWKEDELEDKIYGEQRMLYGEMKFPEFMFKPSQLTRNFSLHCNNDGEGYTVLRRAVCVPCLPGTFFDPYAGNCTRCPINTYQDQLAARSCTRCHRNHYTRRGGSNSSDQCVYHLLKIFARRLPTQYVVVVSVIGVVLVFNCIYALIVNRRQLVTRVSTQTTALRELTPRQERQAQQLGQEGERGYEKQPLLTAATQQTL